MEPQNHEDEHNYQLINMLLTRTDWLRDVCHWLVCKHGLMVPTLAYKFRSLYR
jgi:hypothetical protein